MAYKALYRSYRPQNFEEVAGQTHVVRTLKNALAQDKIAHAYLFCGPRGTGKTTIAKILAKALNCTGEHQPCDECDQCKQIMEGIHPDVIEIDAASNNGVDEVRDLIEKVKYAPISGKKKVYIIDEVHMMTQGAFNALLKTLEEPPAHVVFILATTEPQKILATIISRCIRFDFNKITTNDIVGRLQAVLDEEQIPYSIDALKLVASLADGGMRDALSITEQCLAYASCLEVQYLNEIYGIISNKQKIDFIKDLITKNIPALLKKIEMMLQTGIDIKRLTSDLIYVLKDVVIYKNTKDISCLLTLREDDIDLIIPYITSDEALQFIEILLNADKQYKFASNPALHFELAILKIANQDHEVKDVHPIKEIRKIVKEDEPIKTFEKIEETFEEKVEEPIENIPQDIQVKLEDILQILVQAKRPVLNEINERWGIIKKYTFNLNTAKIAGMICDGKVVAAGDYGFIIAFDFKPDVNRVNMNENYYQIKQFLVEVLGKEYDFIAVTNEEWPDIRNKYMEYRKLGKLPAVGKIKLSHIEPIVEKKRVLSEAEEYAIELFGDIVEIEEEN